jgi:hypothetical protein
MTERGPRRGIIRDGMVNGEDMEMTTKDAVRRADTVRMTKSVSSDL